MPERRKRKKVTAERYLKIGRKNLKKREAQSALKSFDEAIKSDPNYADAYFWRGITYAVLKEREKAAGDFDKAVQLAPNFAHAYVHRGFLYARLGKYDEAMMDFEKAFKLDSTYNLSYLINGGNCLSEQKKYEQALEFYNKALELKPQKIIQARIYGNIGNVFALSHMLDKALDNLNRAIELDPKNVTNLLSRGMLYAELKQYSNALEDFEKAIKQDPKNSAPYLIMGNFYGVNQQFDKAIEAFRKAIELQPKNVKAHFQLAITYEKLRQYDKALEEYDKILALNPKYAHVYTHKGILAGNLCNIPEAISNFDKAIELDSRESIAYLCRGQGHIYIGKYDEALKDFEAAIESNPSNKWAYLGRGQALCYLADENASFPTKKKHEKEMLKSFENASLATDDPNLAELAKWWIRFSKEYCNASLENKKRLKIFAQLYEDALENNLFSTVLGEQNRLTKFISLSKNVPITECYFQILRRWNSFTPAIPEKSRSNLGGGYFFACDGRGIVIDPGYNFIENFIESGLSLGDIDDVILTHAHDDHTADFEAILSLLSKPKGNKKINLFANLGAYVKFSNLVAKNESIIEKIEVLNEKQIYPLTQSLKMKATKAMHKDILTDASAKGLVLDVKRGSRKYRIGITGDTMLFTTTNNENGLYSYFENVDVLILHIGSIHKQEFEFMEDNFEGHKYNGAHLGIRGVVNLIFHCRPKLAIISEFGEELREIRVTIANRLDDNCENYASSGNVRVIPGDIGLQIIFDSKIKVKCEICGELVDLDDIRYTETLINHKIAYHCKRHKREEIVDTFKRKEEKELRFQAESMGCSSDFAFRIPMRFVGHKDEEGM